MYFIKHGKLRNQSPSVETIQAQNVNQIIYGCYTSIVVVNNTGSCTLDVQRTQVVAVLRPDELYRVIRTWRWSATKQSKCFICLLCNLIAMHSYFCS